MRAFICLTTIGNGLEMFALCANDRIAAHEVGLVRVAQSPDVSRPVWILTQEDVSEMGMLLAMLRSSITALQKIEA